MKNILRNYLSIAQLQGKNFKRLWISHGLSQFTNYLLLFVVLGRLFEITHSTVALSMIWIVYALPTFVLGPFTGILIDCLSKRKVLVYTNFLHALVIFAYAFSFIWQKNYLIYSLIFFYSLINQFNNPAELSLVPDLVDKKSLLLTNNLLFFTDQLAFVVGSSLSGILTRIFNPFTTVIVAGLLAFFAGINATTLPFDLPKTKIKQWEKVFEEASFKIKEGYQFLFKKHLLLYTFGLILLQQVILTVGPLILPIFSTKILHLTPYDASYVIILPIACGLAIGTLLLAKKQDKVRKKEWIGNGIFILGSILISFVILVAKMTIAAHFLAIVLAFFAGLAVAITYAPARAFVQETTPAKIRGRVFGALGFLISLVSIPPAIFTTLLVELLGIRLFLFVIGAFLLILGIFILKRGDDVILAANHRS